jgi:hypothetical protein
MVGTDFEINACGSQISMSKLVLEIAHRHAINNSGRYYKEIVSLLER